MIKTYFFVLYKRTFSLSFAWHLGNIFYVEHFWVIKLLVAFPASFLAKSTSMIWKRGTKCKKATHIFDSFIVLMLAIMAISDLLWCLEVLLNMLLYRYYSIYFLLLILEKKYAATFFSSGMHVVGISVLFNGNHYHISCIMLLQISEFSTGQTCFDPHFCVVVVEYYTKIGTNAIKFQCDVQPTKL